MKGKLAGIEVKEGDEEKPKGLHETEFEVDKRLTVAQHRQQNVRWSKCTLKVMAEPSVGPIFTGIEDPKDCVADFELWMLSMRMVTDAEKLEMVPLPMRKRAKVSLDGLSEHVEVKPVHSVPVESFVCKVPMPKMDELVNKDENVVEENLSAEEMALPIVKYSSSRIQQLLLYPSTEIYNKVKPVKPEWSRNLQCKAVWIWPDLSFVSIASFLYVPAMYTVFMLAPQNWHHLSVLRDFQLPAAPALSPTPRASCPLNLVVFNILFGTDEFMRRYHKKINSDPHAEASSWSKDQEREVKYVATTEVPKVMQKLIGDSFPVTELQSFHRNGDCFTIACIPRMESPSADLFHTEAETVLAPNSNGGCAITSNVTLEYRSVWFNGPIESFMEAKARTGFDQWLTLAKLFCQERIAVPSAPKVEDNDEGFFDAQEVLCDNNLSAGLLDSSTPFNRIVSKFKAAFSTATDSGAYGLDSSSRRVSTDDIEQLTTKVLRVEDDLACARLAWERKHRALTEHVGQLNTKLLKMEGDLALVRLSWEKQQSVVLKRRQSALVGAGFAAGFAAGIAVGYLYLRTKRQQ
ncbi:hypothetical protein L7F22_054856 [Adiantum nelumboides]|nr:hypothetical protein [Adiantum nelumboides]